MRRKVNGRMVNISREAMLKEASKIQEFKEDNFDYTILCNEELGAILGYWDSGDGTYYELIHR